MPFAIHIQVPHTASGRLANSPCEIVSSWGLLVALWGICCRGGLEYLGIYLQYASGRGVCLIAQVHTYQSTYLPNLNTS